MPIITEEYAMIGAVTVLFIFGCMFLFSGLSLLIPSLEGNFLLVIFGVLVFVLVVFLARKPCSVIRQSRDNDLELFLCFLIFGASKKLG